MDLVSFDPARQECHDAEREEGEDPGVGEGLVGLTLYLFLSTIPPITYVTPSSSCSTSFSESAVR